MTRPVDDPCPHDPENDRTRCTYRERCPYFLSSGKATACLGTASYDGYLRHLVGASVLLGDPPPARRRPR